MSDEMAEPMGRTQEIRRSASGEVAERWGQEAGGWGHWALIGGTHDGELIGDDEVEGWTELAPKVAAEDLVTSETFELTGPVVGSALGLLRIREDLETLDELVEAVTLVGWSSGMVEQISVDMRDLLGDVRKAADRVEAKLPAVSTEDGEEQQQQQQQQQQDTGLVTLDEILREAGIEYPLGLRGVKDLVMQRESQTERAREAEEPLASIRELMEAWVSSHGDDDRDYLNRVWAVLNGGEPGLPDPEDAGLDILTPREDGEQG